MLLLCVGIGSGLGGSAAATVPQSLADVQATYKAGRTSEAMRQLDGLIAARPRDAQLRFQKGVMLVDQKRPNEAVQVFQKLVQDYPALPEPLNNLAVLYVERGDMEKARTTLEAAIRSKPNYGTAFQNLGDLYTRMASRAYARALQIDDADGAPKLALIRTLYEPPELDISAALVAQAPTPASAPVAKPAASSPVAKPAASVPPPTPAPKPPPVVVAAGPPASLPAALPASPASPVPAPVPVRPAAAPASTPPRPASAAVAVAKPAASAPAARPPKPLPPPTAAPAAEDAEVSAAVRAWALAWSRRDMAGYVAAYAPGFKGGDASADAWQAARRLRILGKNSIKVEVSGIKVEVDKGVARASFRQSYSGGTLEVNSRKTLEFTRVNGRWLIRRESVGG